MRGAFFGLTFGSSSGGNGDLVPVFFHVADAACNDFLEGDDRLSFALAIGGERGKFGDAGDVGLVIDGPLHAVMIVVGEHHVLLLMHRVYQDFACVSMCGKMPGQPVPEAVMSKIPASLIPYIGSIVSMQNGLPRVQRWKKYLHSEEGVREQNTLQHSHALVVVTVVSLRVMGLVGRVDEGFLIGAAALHDVGEGELGYDTLYIDKSTNRDLQEYLAFERRFSRVPEFVHLRELFLLQFALHPPMNFPEDAHAVMTWLALNRQLEAQVFEALERWDYLLFALEQYEDRGNAKVLVQVLRHQVPHFERILVELPEFVELWTPELAVFSKRFMDEHEGKWIERKGES